MFAVDGLQEEADGSGLVQTEAKRGINGSL